ncbi:hypothetical protein EDD11_008265 [Mortierella claussenii]|nr:hypothetical protein EDD11_008265 [Mortierella claussenii]
MALAPWPGSSLWTDTLNWRKLQKKTTLATLSRILPTLVLRAGSTALPLPTIVTMTKNLFLRLSWNVPAQFADSCRTQLMNLKMTSTFSEFVSSFKELLQALLSFVTDGTAQTVAKDFAQTAFLDNCPKDLQQMLSGHLLNNPETSLSQLFTLSEQLDRIYNFAPTSAPRIAPRSPPLITAPAVTSLYGPPPATPMEIDNLMFLANIGRQALTNYSFRPGDNTTSSTFNDNNRPPKLSPDEKARLLQRGACFRCRRDGHMANQCTAFGRQQQQHRQINNVATEEIPGKSGKVNDN